MSLSKMDIEIRPQERWIGQFTRSTFDPRLETRGMINSYRTNIICPVCGSHECEWWYRCIRTNTAGQVLNDMMDGMFHGDMAYMGGDQEYYYQNRRNQWYKQNRQQGTRRPPNDYAKDIDYEIVETVKKLKQLQDKKKGLSAPNL